MKYIFFRDEMSFYGNVIYYLWRWNIFFYGDELSIWENSYMKYHQHGFEILLVLCQYSYILFYFPFKKNNTSRTCANKSNSLFCYTILQTSLFKKMKKGKRNKNNKLACTQ